MTQHLAIDLGAESGRALIGHLDTDRLALTDLHRFANTPVRDGSSLRWDVGRLWAEMQHAIASAERFQPTSVGVDAWGCDYALLDAGGDLLEAPYHYRDSRTDGVMAEVVERVSRERLYTTTGVQLLPFNTIFQLYAASRQQPGLMARAHRLLTIPDFFNYRLTGRLACEYTNATTTQCVDASTRRWARPLIEELGLPPRLFGDLIEPGTTIGVLGGTFRGGAGMSVVAPACHDTGSAVASVHAAGDTAFLSSGTWSLLGVEIDRPVITPRSQQLNFTNEGGVLGTTRLLKNITGLWLLQACRADWAAGGAAYTYDALVAGASSDTRMFRSTIDPDDRSFLNPTHMPAAIAAFCRRTGQPVPEDPAAFARTIFESLALKYRLVLDWLAELTGTRFRAIRVIGGGARNRLLNQLTADATGCDVLAGPVEATALGNIAMQMVATGQVPSLGAARDIIDRSFPAERYRPSNTERWEQPYRRLREYVELACA